MGKIKKRKEYEVAWERKTQRAQSPSIPRAEYRRIRCNLALS
jgi:hypothetical protein